MALDRAVLFPPNVFSLFSTTALAQALDIHVGVKFRFKINGMVDSYHASGFTEILIQELLFANDAAIVTDNLDDLQLLMDRISTALTNWGLIISISKTKTTYQVIPGF